MIKQLGLGCKEENIKFTPSPETPTTAAAPPTPSATPPPSTPQAAPQTKYPPLYPVPEKSAADAALWEMHGYPEDAFFTE